MALFLGADISNAGSSWDGSSIGSDSNVCTPSNTEHCAYVSNGTLSKGEEENTLNYTNSTLNSSSAFTLTAKGATINITKGPTTNAIDINKNIVTLSLTNSYLKFEDNATAMNAGTLHGIRIQNGASRLNATFNGGIGVETIKNQEYNNIAFYGMIFIYTTNDQANSITFNNGANMVGWLRNGTDLGYLRNTVNFNGGGNLIAIDQNHYTSKWDNAKGKAINLARSTSVTNNGNAPAILTLNFGTKGQKEYVTDTNLLDKDGVIVKKINNGDVQKNATLNASQTLITNAIKGDIYVAGYVGQTSNAPANLTLNFYNNGLIDGAISTSSLANIKIYFANKGTIRSNLNFSAGGDGSTGSLVIAKSESEARVDDLTIEGSITNNGLTTYKITADKFLMDGYATIGGGKALTFDTYQSTFNNFTLNNSGTTNITTKNVTFNKFSLNNTGGSTTISATEGGATFKDFTLNNTSTTKITTKTFLVIDGSNSDITTKGNLTITNEATSIDDSSAMSSINIKGLYGIGAYNTTSDTIITTKGNVNMGILAAIKQDGSGNGNIKNTLNVDNSNNAGKVTLSVIDSTSTTDNLVLRGGSIDGNKLANNGNNLTTRSNIVMFSNMTGGKSEATLKGGANSSISVIGDIYTIQGNNNLKLVDTNRATSDIPEFIGNIVVNNGKANIIFDGTLWAPSNISDLTSLSSNQTLANYIQQYGTGKVSTTNGGVANIALRQGQNSTFGQQSVFAVDTKGNSQTNILIQKNTNTDLNIAATIDYDNQATTRIIFAGSNTGVSSESFGGTNNFSNVGTSGVQMFGVTYKDGVMFEVGAKSNAQRNLIQRYRGVFGDGALLTLSSSINSNGTNLSISGLFMGNAIALAPTTITKAPMTYNINIATNSVVAGNIQNQTTDKLNVVLDRGAKIFLDPTVSNKYGTTNEFVTLEFKNATHSYDQDLIDSIRTTNTVIDLGTMGVDYASLATQTPEAYNLLKIASLSGENASFRVRVGDQNGDKKNIGANGSNLTGYADRAIIEATKDSKILREFLQPIYTSNVNVDTITYTEGGENNIAVLTVKNDTNGNALVNLGALDAIEGFDQISSGLKAVKTDENGGNTNTDYTTYYLSQAESKGASMVVSDISAQALGMNYDLYLANLNSLNKRMGDLRYNDNAQGVWARVFNGQQTTTFGLETKSTYTTIQAGYDYAIGMEGANNYLGLALSYAMSSTSTESLMDINATLQGIDSVKSQAIEVALYNAYVQDGASSDNGFAKGLYSDTILKFSYIMSDFNLLGQSNNYSTNNYALTLSQELGYRFLLGANKEWFIDPQAEISVGYLNQTDLKQTLESGAYLDGVQSAIITLRGRVGSNFGYKFDRWTESKGFKAQIYLGTYFVGDYISGGDVSLTTTRGINTSLTPLASTSRALINVGTNFDIKNQHKIYFDFEKSFGGTIVTDYQVNLGYRFSFGENVGYTPSNTNKKEIAPLKISDENTQATQESKESVENTQEQKENSTENKAQ